MVCVEGWRCLNGRVWNLFFFKQKTADEMRISDWSSDVCSSDLIIKALDEHSHGFYAPSPGVIYPALTYLEEIGFATVAAEGAKKLYSITEEGSAYLADRRTQANTMLAELARVGERIDRKSTRLNSSH